MLQPMTDDVATSVQATLEQVDLSSAPIQKVLASGTVASGTMMYSSPALHNTAPCSRVETNQLSFFLV